MNISRNIGKKIDEYSPVEIFSLNCLSKAILDMQGRHPTQDDEEKRAARNETIDWFYSDNEDFMSFRHICSQFEIEPENLRSLIENEYNNSERFQKA